MTVKKLEQTQLFSMKRPGLERRFSQHFEEYHSVQHIIESAVIVMVRNAFSPFDYSYLAKDLIRQLFLESDVQELAAVRHYCVLFREYLSSEEWHKVLGRLFENHKEYLAVTQAIREKTDHLHTMLHSGSREATELMNISTVYKDAAGKKHRFTLKEADPCYSIDETTDLLSILNTVTILEKDGVRRFTELVRYIYLPTEPVYDSERETEEDVEAEVAAETEPTEELHKTLNPLIQEAVKHLEKLAEDKVKNGLDASFVVKSDVYTSKSSDEAMAYLLDGFTLPDKVDDKELVGRLVSAFVRGIKLKDAQPEFFINEAPKDTSDPDKNSGKKVTLEGIKSKKSKKKKRNKKRGKKNKRK